MFNLKSTLSWASVSMRSLTAMTRAWVNSWGDSVLGRQRQRIWVKMVKSLGSYQDVYELGFTSQWLISLFLSSYHWLCPMKRWYPYIFAYTYYGYLWISMDIYGYLWISMDCAPWIPMKPNETSANFGQVDTFLAWAAWQPDFQWPVGAGSMKRTSNNCRKKDI